jgi:hypothetical protein
MQDLQLRNNVILLGMCVVAIADRYVTVIVVASEYNLQNMKVLSIHLRLKTIIIIISKSLNLYIYIYFPLFILTILFNIIN